MIDLVKSIKGRNKDNRNFIAVFVGETGAGKSWSALRLAEMIDDGFSQDRVIFEPEDFLEAISEHEEATLVFDDAGIGLSSREAMSKLNRSIGKVSQSFRFKLINLLITAPTFGMIDLQARSLTHALFHVWDRGKASYYRLWQNPFHASIWRRKVATVYFDKPSRELRERYEERKRNFLNSYYDTLIK